MEVPYRDRAPAPRWLLVVALVAAALSGIAIVTVDQPLARFLAQYRPLAIWDHVMGSLEWAVGLQLIPWTSGIALVLALLVTLAVPRWRREVPAWMFVAAVHLLSRIAMVEIKDLTGRLRPLEWLQRGGDETFGWVNGISYPSGHVVLFASLVIPLAVLVPRTRPLLAVAAFVMAARLAVNAHFASDVIGAITLVTLVAWAASVAIRPLRTERPRASRR
ncbi:MAG: phosphatase PAP2 family protein [Deltaproteobacteria bacterium]|nr:phosphatase PAP2 family protein [Deltaproteobacteria bacterium]